MENDKQVQFLPFHAINQFMLPEFRQQVISTVLRDLESLSGERRSRLNNLIRKSVQVPGFRNSAQAPLPVRIKGSITTFERSPEFVAQVLQGWVELHPDLAERIYQMLKARNWELLPVAADRTKLPGFLTTWEKSETYEVLDQSFMDANPGFEATSDDIRLMVVWLAGRLPFDIMD